MLTKKDVTFLKNTFATKEDLKELTKKFVDTFATKQDLQDEARNTRDFVHQENQRMKKEIVGEIVDVVTVVMNRIENHEARLIVLETN